MSPDYNHLPLFWCCTHTQIMKFMVVKVWLQETVAIMTAVMCQEEKQGCNELYKLSVLHQWRFYRIYSRSVCVLQSRCVYVNIYSIAKGNCVVWLIKIWAVNWKVGSSVPRRLLFIKTLKALCKSILFKIHMVSCTNTIDSQPFLLH